MQTRLERIAPMDVLSMMAPTGGSGVMPSSACLPKMHAPRGSAHTLWSRQPDRVRRFRRLFWACTGFYCGRFKSPGVFKRSIPLTMLVRNPRVNAMFTNAKFNAWWSVQCNSADDTRCWCNVQVSYTVIRYSGIVLMILSIGVYGWIDWLPEP